MTTRREIRDRAAADGRDPKTRRLIVILAVLTALSMLVTTGSLWYAFRQAKADEERAQTKAQTAVAGADAAAAYLAAACDDGDEGACRLLLELDKVIAGIEDEVNEAEIQESEIQEPEIQEPENQEPEGNDPERQDPERQDPESQEEEVQEGEEQEAEVQDEEIQEPENQEPEIQDPEKDDPDPNDPDEPGPMTCTQRPDDPTTFDCVPA